MIYSIRVCRYQIDSEINTDWQPDDVFDEIVADAEEALANEPEINGVKSHSTLGVNYELGHQSLMMD